MPVYVVGRDVTAPQLVPTDFPIRSVHRCKESDGSVLLAAIVDADGTPRNVTVMRSIDTNLDRLAQQIVSADRFKPGVRNGAPVAVAMLIEATIQTCTENGKNGDGLETGPLALRSQPEQRVSAPANVPPVLVSALNGFRAADSSGLQEGGQKISAPVPLYQPNAEYSDYARRKGISGICLVRLIVDANGNPQNVRIVKSLEPSLDQKAIEAVKGYRFKPAMRDGTVPVPVMVTVEVSFHLYKKW